MSDTEDVWIEARASVDLPTALGMIEKYDKAGNYEKRAVFVYHALALAARLGMECGIRYDSSEGAAWPVVSIVLPTGEVAWHCKATSKAYDGHSTEEKYERIRAYCQPQ
jgi:hypothetical protein